MTPADQLCEETYVQLIDEGVNLFAQGEYFAAQVKFWQAFRIRPSSPIVLYNLGRTMEELRDPNAINFYEAAALQGNVDASYQLATLYVLDVNSDANKEAAIRHLKFYLKNSKVDDDDYTKWAKQTLNQLDPPKLKLIWNKGKKIA